MRPTAGHTAPGSTRTLAPQQAPPGVSSMYNQFLMSQKVGKFHCLLQIIARSLGKEATPSRLSSIQFRNTFPREILISQGSLFHLLSHSPHREKNPSEVTFLAQDPFLCFMPAPATSDLNFSPVQLSALEFSLAAAMSSAGCLLSLEFL